MLVGDDLPELGADLVAALASLDVDNFSHCVDLSAKSLEREGKVGLQKWLNPQSYSQRCSPFDDRALTEPQVKVQGRRVGLVATQVMLMPVAARTRSRDWPDLKVSGAAIISERGHSAPHICQDQTHGRGFRNFKTLSIFFIV